MHSILGFVAPCTSLAVTAVTRPVIPCRLCSQSFGSFSGRTRRLGYGSKQKWGCGIQSVGVAQKKSLSPLRRGQLVCSAPDPLAPQDTATGGESIPNDAPAPGGSFYLGTAGALSLLALVIPQIVAGSLPSIPIDSHYVMLALIGGFAVAHSGLASLRPRAVELVGERAYRVLFALVSIPGAVGTISYFVAHRYDGAQLWTLQGIPGVREAVWAATFVSFLLLYPATFNLAEVAAIKKPGFRIYESGVMRITRHPQLWGQVIWCVAHAAWMGTSLTAVASLGLVAHHCFAVWNGDRRLKDRFGEEWEAYAARTSVLPFRAVLDGRQRIEVKELAVKAYLGVLVFIIGTYVGHPAMLRAIASLDL